MRLILHLALLFCYVSCSQKHHEQAKSEEATFRITLNYNKELSDSELDSLEHSKPLYSETFRTNELYDLLVNKGFVSNQTLDTSGLNFTLVTWEKPIAEFGQVQVMLDTAKENDHIVVKGNGKDLKLDLGRRLLGDIFVSCMDIDSDDQLELLVMKKYYVMGGYNFDLKMVGLN